MEKMILEMARRHQAIRRGRRAMLEGSDLATEGPWDLLLAIFIAEEEKGAPVDRRAAGRLCQAPASLLDRWIAVLGPCDLLVAEPGPTGRISMTETARGKLEQLLREAAAFSASTSAH
ncbi:hypothetical protein [Sphingomonas sp. TZW2008]|uniref:hypothetical protein n=1 Tax=Sphingomonas sp. TZW2008 TaxID=1917973 RepID=UPI000A26B21E|nr:hypothetical protein [Sphingomonas sp. TZW2008]